MRYSSLPLPLAPSLSPPLSLRLCCLALQSGGGERSGGGLDVGLLTQRLLLFLMVDAQMEGEEGGEGEDGEEDEYGAEGEDGEEDKESGDSSAEEDEPIQGGVSIV